MAREISHVGDFIFRSIWTGLLMDNVDIELTVRMIKGIYTYRKDHTAGSMVFSPWSRTIIAFPSLTLLCIVTNCTYILMHFWHIICM